MILLAYGPNYFARDKKIRELIDAKRIQYPDVFYAVYQGDDPEVNERVWSGVAETGLFSSGKRIIVVHNALVCAKQNEELWKQSMTRATHDDVLCILLEKGTKENKKWEKEITAGAEYKAQFFKPYTQKDACIVLRTLAEECKTTIDVNTAMYIYQTAGEDMY
jgi:DNA polymerase III delta subunit